MAVALAESCVQGTADTKDEVLAEFLARLQHNYDYDEGCRKWVLDSERVQSNKHYLPALVLCIILGMKDVMAENAHLCLAGEKALKKISSKQVLESLQRNMTQKIADVTALQPLKTNHPRLWQRLLDVEKGVREGQVALLNVVKALEMAPPKWWQTKKTALKL